MSQKRKILENIDKEKLKEIAEEKNLTSDTDMEKKELIDDIEDNYSLEEIKSKTETHEEPDLEKNQEEEWGEWVGFRKTIIIVTILLILIVIVAFYLSLFA